jgi:L,D-transpeptidase YnhG
VNWRFKQRGHANVSPVLMGLGAQKARHLVVGLAVLVAAGVVVWASTTLFLANPVASADVDPAVASLSSADKGPSLLTSALAKVQHAAENLGDTVPSGLASTPLSDRSLQLVLPTLGQAEARLIDIYQNIGKGRHREALAQAETLVNDHPNFHLAQLVLGDLLTLQTRPLRRFGDVSDSNARAASEQLTVLRDESRRRMRALTERPIEGSVPAQFLTLSSQSRHAIAIDASRSRLYLFANEPRASSSDGSHSRLRLLGDFYISVGLQGVEKSVEGDKRTPLGVYYITSNLNPSNLPDLYGVGALPINYPNPLDVMRGKTGSGIWLHGTPREQFVRAPQASDGCVVLSNPDLERLLATVEIRTTPVVIAPELRWVQPEALDTERDQFQGALEAWRQAKGGADLDRLKDFYSTRFQTQGRDLNGWWPRLESEVRSTGQGELQLKELSMLHWRDKEDTMVVTFGEVPEGKSRGVTKRQYWTRERDQWKIFYEGPV